MTIIDLDYLGIVAGVTYDPHSAEGKQAQHYIDAVEAYVSTVTGLTFAAVSDAKLRCQADYYGIVEFTVEPSSVKKVAAANDPGASDLLTTAPLSPWTPGCTWDGLSTIYGLAPHQVVDVTLDYGSEITTALQSWCADAVLEILNGTDPTDIETMTIGNRTETYQKVETVVDKLDQEVLAQFRVTETTWRLGVSQPPWSKLPWRM